jgi:hypothetical protein
VHWKAHPMFQVPPATVKAGLVQFPRIWVAGSRIVAVPVTGMVVVELGAVVVVLPEVGELLEVVVELPLVADVVVVPLCAEPEGGGRL